MPGRRVTDLPQEIQEMILDKMVEGYESLHRCEDGKAFKYLLHLARTGNDRLQEMLAESVIRTLKLPLLLPQLRMQRDIIGKVEYRKAVGTDDLFSNALADSWADLHRKFYRQLLSCYQGRFEKPQLHSGIESLENGDGDRLRGYHGAIEELFELVEQVFGYDGDSDEEEERLAFWDESPAREIRWSVCRALWLPKSLTAASPDTRQDLAQLALAMAFLCKDDLCLCATWRRSYDQDVDSRY